MSPGNTKSMNAARNLRLPHSAKEPGLAQAARARALHGFEAGALGDKAPIGELRIVAVMFLQQHEQIVDLDEGLLGQFAALRLGRDVDRPRNLAKSVTVE